MNVLDQILQHKRAEVAQASGERPLDEIRRLAREQPAPPPFAAALRAAPMGLIAEIKRRSPSAGTIREPFDPVAIAQTYARGGAHAISVLMDRRYFGGGEEICRLVRAAVSLPMLYKEFVVSPWQIWHARALGASAVLLIVAALSPDELRRLFEECRAAGVEALVEVHDESDLDRALQLNPECLGINHRDLKTLRVDLSVTERLRPRVPESVTLICESGIRSPEDVVRLKRAGAHGILVGEHLLRQPDPAAAIRELMSRVW